MRKKVLQIAFYAMDIGGVQKDIIDYAENIPEYLFDVVVFSKGGRMEETFKKFGGEVYNITEYEGSNPLRKFVDLFIKKFRIFFSTYRIIKKHGPYEAIHSHCQFRCAFTNAAAYFAGVKIRIAHSHNDKPPFKYSLFKRILLNIYRLMLLIFSNVRLACSEDSGKYLFWKADRGEVILNGTSMERFDIDKYKYKSDGINNFIHVGRYNIQKNQMFLLEIFSHVVRALPDSRLKLIGFGEDEEMIRQRVSKTDLKDNVSMHPGDSDVPKFLSEAEFMIFPSLYEGFPNVQIEAQAMGVECFVSDTVTRESDLGLSTYIDLSKSAEEWADKIVEKVRLHDFSRRYRITEDQKKRIDAAVVSRRYADIYNGDIQKK